MLTRLFKQLAKNNTGMSFIEITVSILILSGIFVGIIQAFPYSMALIKFSENETKAGYLAQEKIEELYSFGYDNIATGTLEVKHRLGASGDYLYFFQRQTEVTCVDESLSDSIVETGLKKISVTMYYTNTIGKTEKSFTISTLLADRTPEL